MSVFYLIIMICTGLLVFLSIVLWIVFAGDYSAIQMTLKLGFDKKEIENIKLFKGLIKVSTYLAVVLSLLLLYLSLM